MTRATKRSVFIAVLGIGGSVLPLGQVNSTYAGVFNIPHFIAPKEFAAGVEPELTFTGTTDAAINLRYAYGLNDQNNVHIIAGTGSGSRQLRLGGAYTIDIFPDVGNQPGIGFAAQALFVRLPGTGSVEVTGIPYIHKTFETEGIVMEPFFAIPIGISLYQGRYDSISTLAFGSLFQHSKHISSVLELGVSLGKSNTYLSGGIVYYN